MGFIFAPLVGLLADRFGRRKILLLSTIGQAIGFFIMGAAKSIFWLFVARTTTGSSERTLPPRKPMSLMSHLQKSAPALSAGSERRLALALSVDHCSAGS